MNIRIKPEQVDAVRHAIFQAGGQSVATIAKKAGIRHQPTVRRILRELNFLGTPVVATEKGVFVATEPCDVYAYVDELEGRAASLTDRASMLRSIAQTMGAQRKLDGRPC
jgi:hypothetical protein